MDSLTYGYAAYGKIELIGTDIPYAWDLKYDGKKIAGYDGRTNYCHNTIPEIDLRGLYQQNYLQRLYTWKFLLEDRKEFFAREFRKIHFGNSFYNITCLDHYFHQIILKIQNDINTIDFDNEYEKKKNTLKGVSFVAKPDFKKPVFYSFEQLQEKIDSLIAIANSPKKKIKASASRQKDMPQKKVTNRAVTDDPKDRRNVWLGWAFGCFIKNSSNEYEIPHRKMQKFIDLCFQYVYLVESDNDGEDDFDIDWLLDYVNIHSKRETIRKYIERQKVSQKKERK